MMLLQQQSDPRARVDAPTSNGFWKKQPAYQFIQGIPKRKKKTILPVARLRTKNIHSALFQIRREKQEMDHKIK